MKSKTNILFIVNPISGVGKQRQIASLLKKYLDLEKYKFEIVFTEYSEHAISLSKNAIGQFDMVVAVGGDGTINEVAKSLTNSSVVMGILPVGSGNGLARHLKIPLQLKNSIKKLNEAKIQTIDTANINGKCFVNVAGIGFDAHVAHLYANTKKRGAIPYVKLVTTEFRKYQPVDYKVFIDDKPYHFSAFLISFANSSQFGNNAYISPKALINDGLIDVCMLSKFPIVKSGGLGVKLLNKKIDKSKYMNIVQGKKICIKTEGEIKAHIDGEPIILPNELNVIVNPLSLKIIC